MKSKKTYEIVNLLTEATKSKNQNLINACAYELATRLYVPGTAANFDDLLYGFGYRVIEKQNPNQITMGEYMKEVENYERSRKRNEDN